MSIRTTPGTPANSRLSGDARDVRDLAILKTKITTGMDNETLAQQFNVSTKTVERAMSTAAEKHDLLAKFEAQLLDELVPEAVRAVKVALKNDNANVALEILKGAGILKKQRDMNRISEGGEGDSLELYIKAKRTKPHTPAPQGQPADPAPGASPLQLPPNTGLGNPETGPPAAQPSGSDGWLPHIERLVHDNGMDVVEGQILRTDSETVDEADE
jgi:hypothetical protein